MRRQGTVTAIDHANHVLRATIDGIPDIEATYYAGDPRDPYCRMPWPLCNAWFSYRGTGLWHCDGPIGHRRVLFHDDFLRSGLLDWQADESDISAGSGLGAGTVQIASGQGIYKDAEAITAPTSPSVLHLCVKWLHTLTANVDALGFTSNLSNYAGLSVNYSAGAITCFGGEAAGGQIEGSVPTVDRFYVADIMLDYDAGRVIGWVDGNGPVSATLSGDITSSVTPWLKTFTSGLLVLDYATCSVVTPANNLPG